MSWLIMGFVMQRLDFLHAFMKSDVFANFQSAFFAKLLMFIRFIIGVTIYQSTEN
jgi:hypothetical protein